MIGSLKRLWDRFLENKRVPIKYIKFIKDIYDGILTTVKTSVSITVESLITIQLHQRSALSSYLFVLFINELTKLILEEVPFYIFFRDDIILVDETGNGVNAKL